MSQEHSHQEPSAQILEEASDWFVEFNDGEVNGAQRRAFNLWIRRSPEHVRAFLEISAAWERSSGLPQGRAEDVQALIAQALAETNVIPISAAAGQVQPQLARRPSIPAIGRARRYSLAAAAAALIISATVAYTFDRNTYATEIGEQRSIILPDGSKLELNSHSKVRIDYSSRERTVDLLQGQALFEVSKDPTRPFTVHSDGTRVRAVGTQFDVYRKTSGATIVTVLEGKVIVAAAVPKPVPLNAGEQLVVATRGAMIPKQANVADVTAWTHHKLVFDDAPLAEVVEEFNRYNAKRMIIDDAGLEAFHVRGAFPADGPERLIEMLRARFNVEVTDTDGAIRIARTGT